MNTFFLLIEVLGYAFAFFLFIKKEELALIYIPVLIFSNTLIVPVLPAFLYYSVISFLIIYVIIKNGFFYRNNIYAILLFLYFLILLTRSSNLDLIRPQVFSALWLFISIPLISEVYQKYPREVIFKEVTNSALIILVLFIINALVSTKMGYAPTNMYGITKGILYGNLYAADFNVLAIAIFAITLKMLDKKKPVYFIIFIISLSFIMLSLRRSVMLVSFLGAAIAFLTLLTQRDAKKFIVFGSIILLMGYVVYSSTDFMNEFKERYELRNLSERDLGEEKRFFEYGLIYQDMFVDGKYSQWLGYELFNSAGHYGNGVFDTRTLHGDIPSITHSSGLIGVMLYLLMVITAFLQSYKATLFAKDKLIVLFCAVAFVSFTGTGRFTECGYTLLLYLILMLPLARDNVLTDDMFQLNDSGSKQ